MLLAGPEWQLAGFVLHLAGALACALAALWVASRGDRVRPDRVPTAWALLLTAGWAVAVAALGADALLADIVESARNLAWIFVLYRLFAADGRHESLSPIRPVVAALAFVECLQPVLQLVGHQFGMTPELAELVLQLRAMFHMLVAVGALVLLHNLYVGASAATRQVLRWSTASLAALWAFDLNFYTVGYLDSHFPEELAAIRGLAIAVFAFGLALGLKSDGATLRLRPSRAMAFQSLSLLVIGGYMLVMLAIAEWLEVLGGEFGRLTQVGFLFAATLMALLWLPSQRLRAWLKVTVVKHLFQHRYDYRAEWLRFTETISKGGSATFEERVVQAMAEMTDSRAGLLMLPGDGGAMALAARWNWRTVDVPGTPLPAELVSLLEREDFILDLGEVRAGCDHHGEAKLVPDWLIEQQDSWAIVPLLHFDRLNGVVVLAKPSIDRRLDWQDYDLLKLAGQQLASYLAEQATQRALLEASRFDEFNRRMAFVMHDIKNLASQLSLLARNAERHADKPAFRADMLVTLRSSSDKLNTLLARLGRYVSTGHDRNEQIDLVALVKQIAAKYASVHNVRAVAEGMVAVRGDPEALEQALVHLVQNAVEASEPGSPVFIQVSADAVVGRVEVVDSGTGMTAEFIRTGLFKPFVSSKSDGFGIGAFEARELIRAMGGRLEVESRPGLGSRFLIDIPLAATVDLAQATADANAMKGAA